MESTPGASANFATGINHAINHSTAFRHVRPILDMGFCGQA